MPPGGDESDLTTDLPARNHSSREDQQDSAVGELIDGKYKLIEIIGEGGMGSVYLAQQTEPVRRHVALKLIKPGLDSKAVIARFEAERQALALMDHPNIAKILDGGLHQNRPFFVMELVKGVPITQYCDTNKLTPHQRLELFMPVCHAFQHAHQKGIIHRDIKPSNVMVALYDDKPVPKVIDFGLAKATGGSLSDLSLNTVFGGVAGTPQYMSPEQATLNNLDIDTRSDIYSLGVLLYELLAGSPPFKRKDLERAGLMEVLHVIREEEPPKPSTKLSNAETLPSLSANRGSEPRRLMGILRHELDWIVMKALEKDRRRRYETANGFAADINRYLCGEAVLAHPPSRGYWLKKFLRKNRGPVIAVSLVFLVLTFGVIGTTYGMIEATHQKHVAEGRSHQLEKSFDLTSSIFRDLNSRNLSQTKKPLEAVLLERLIRAGEELDAKAIDDPLIVAKLQDELGETLITLDSPEEAIKLLKPAVKTRTELLGKEHRDTLNSMENLAEGYFYARAIDNAIPLFEETLEKMKTTLGPEDATTLICMNNLAKSYQSIGNLDRAMPLLKKTFEIRKATLGLEEKDTLISMTNLASGYQEAKQFDLALPLYEAAVNAMRLKFPDDPDTRACMYSLAEAYEGGGKAELANRLYKEALEMNSSLLTLKTISFIDDLASAYARVRRFDQAMPLFDEALRAKKKKLPPNHPDTLKSMTNLAFVYINAGKFIQAVPLLEETVYAKETVQGPDNPDTLFTINVLASAYLSTKQFDRSIPLLKKVIKLLESKKSRQHPAIQEVVLKLGVHYKEAGRIDEAIPLLEEAYHTSRQTPAFKFDVTLLLDAYMKGGKSPEAEKFVQEELAKIRKSVPEGSPRLAAPLARFGLVLLRQKAFSQAESLLQEALVIDEKMWPAEWVTFDVQSMLGDALLGQKKYGEAEPLLLKGYEGLKQREEKLSPQNKFRLIEALDRIIELYTAMEKPAEVKKWQEIKARLPKTLPKENPKK